MALKNVTNQQVLDALRLMGYGDDILGGVSLAGAQNSEFRQRIVSLGIHDTDFDRAKGIARDVGDETFNAGGNQVTEAIAALQRRGVSDDVIRRIVGQAVSAQKPAAGGPAQISAARPGSQMFDVPPNWVPQNLAAGMPLTGAKIDVNSLLDAAAQLTGPATESVRSLITKTPGGSVAPPPSATPPQPVATAAPATAPVPASAPSAAADARSTTIALQQALNAKGAGLVVDGIMGPRTKAAAAKYGVSTGTPAAGPATGGASPATAAATGGTTGPVKLAANAPVADQIAYLKEHYGYSAWTLDDPELKPIFIQAATEGWDANKLKGALEPTQFWQTHNATQRTTIEQKNSDPAAYQAGVRQTRAEIVADAGRQGLSIDPGRLDQIATDAYTSGWSAAQITQATGAEFHYDPNASTQPGEVGNLKGIAAAYLVPLDDTTIQQWGGDILSGKVTDAEFTEYIKGIAKGLFPTMAASIDAGQTVAQRVAPYRTAIASTLEIDPGSVDFMDPKYMRLLSSVDPKTNQPVMKPLYDTMTELRTNQIYNYQDTSQAKQQAAQFSQLLGQTWGVGV